MSELKEYRAIQDFSLSLGDPKNVTYVKRGDSLEFDGLNVNFRGESGAARSLSKVIGEWIVPTDKKLSEIKIVPTKKLARPFRNATAGKVIEHSDYTSDPDVGVTNPPSDSVETLLKSYEQTSPTKLVNGKREVTSDLDDIKREVTITHEEDNVVRKVRAVDEGTTNKNSVEMGKTKEVKRAVLSPEGNIAKKTNYSGKKAESTERKKLTIDYEASGVEVRKVSTNKTPVAKVAAKTEVFENEIDVGETSYPTTQTTDVGSSTQAHIESNKTPAKKAPAKKAATKKAPAKKTTAKKTTAKKASVVNKPLSTAPTVIKGTVVDSGGQEAVVISKVKRNDASRVESTDGIVSKITIGATGDMDVGEVQFSSNSDFEEPGVTIGSGEETPLDMIDSSIFEGDTETDEDSSADTGVIAVEDDIDLNSLLSDV